MKNDLFKALAEELAPYLMPYFENKVKDVLSSLPDYKKDIPEFFYKETGDV